MESGSEDVHDLIREVSSFHYVQNWDLKMCMSLLEWCPHFRGCYVQASMELGPEDVHVPIRERCPHFRGCYVQASMELGPEDVSSFQRVLRTGFNEVET